MLRVIIAGLSSHGLVRLLSQPNTTKSVMTSQTPLINLNTYMDTDVLIADRTAGSMSKETLSI